MNRKVDRHTKAIICSPILITQAQVRLAISNSSLNNSTGPGGTNIRHLKHLGPRVIQHLTHLFNTSLNTNVIPHIWKLAKIFPFQSQTKDSCSGTSFRLISLLSAISKVLEKIKGYCEYQNHRSKSQQFKTGVPQGGVLSPTLFNLYTSDLPLPPEDLSVTMYADDMTPAASHSDYHIAEDRLQLYLNDIFKWTKENNLTLNRDNSTETLFTPDTHEHNITLNLSINNITIPIVKKNKILGLTFVTVFNFGAHVTITKVKADSTVKILKALTSTSWGKKRKLSLQCTRQSSYPSLNTPAQSGHPWYLQPINRSYNQRRTMPSTLPINAL